jgi:hypothetical protein
MHQIQIRSQVQGVGVTEDHGLARRVGRGHDQGVLLDVVEEKMMHPSIRQEHPYGAQARGDPFVDEPLPLMHQDHRSMGREQQPLLELRGHAVPACGLQVPDHDGERLLVPAVPGPQAREGGQRGANVHAAPALGHTYGPVVKPLRKGLDGVPRIYVVPIAVKEVEGRPAPGAGNGLVMEPSCRWLIVLVPAFRVHGEVPHGGPHPVIREVLDDGEPSPAVGAVRKGV